MNICQRINVLILILCHLSRTQYHHRKLIIKSINFHKISIETISTNHICMTTLLIRIRSNIFCLVINSIASIGSHSHIYHISSNLISSFKLIIRTFFFFLYDYFSKAIASCLSNLIRRSRNGIPISFRYNYRIIICSILLEVLSCCMDTLITSVFLYIDL